ncbi:hypothetical protein MTR_4g035357 [Medicago truncatula]|uniref:Uncharacterized protein n=1 Tax=Medicago truncatula TaxID=3880 RepID=A0A072UHX4_MEDTR|nr:hypothetical protein MTR_4g035357 [Medicago truncatula]
MTSQEVTHHSTTLALAHLTVEFLWDPVHQCCTLKCGVLMGSGALVLLQATKEEEIEVCKIGNRPPIFAAILSFGIVKNRPPIWYFLGTRSVEIGHRF